jgi:hypothetical protein
MVKSEYDDRFLKTLSNAVSFVTNEAVVLAQYEAVQEGRFAWLWPADDNGEFDERVHRVIRHLGGPPQIYVKGNDEEPPLIAIIPGLLVLLSQPHDRIVVKDSVCVFQLLLSLYLRCRAMSTSSGIPGRSVLQSWLDPAKASGDVCKAKSPLRARP